LNSIINRNVIGNIDQIKNKLLALEVELGKSFQTIKKSLTTDPNLLDVEAAIDALQKVEEMEGITQVMILKNPLVIEHLKNLKIYLPNLPVGKQKVCNRIVNLLKMTRCVKKTTFVSTACVYAVELAFI